MQTRAGILSLLCTWLHNCPLAVTHFLQSSSNIPFVSFSSLRVLEVAQRNDHKGEDLCLGYK